MKTRKSCDRQTDGTIKIGCCGFPVSRDKYYSTFPVVEIQQTFYQPPKIKTARKWKAEAPEDFEFLIKAWQVITHRHTSPTYRRLKKSPGNPENYGSFKNTREVKEAWEITKEFAEALGATGILFQCPSSFAPTADNISSMREFFFNIKPAEFSLFLELRGEWQTEQIKSICAELGLFPALDPFSREIIKSEIGYFRLHGKGGYKYAYTEEDLMQLARICSEFSRGYCLFNNISMFSDARRFLELLDGSSNQSCDKDSHQ